MTKETSLLLTDVVCGVEVDLVDGAGVTGQLVEDAARRRVPDVDVAVPGARRHLTAVRGPGAAQQVLRGDKRGGGGQ